MDAMTALLHVKKFAQDRLTVTAPNQGLYEITGDVQAWLEAQNVTAGLSTLYLRHTSASLLIQENEDLDVLRDLEDFFAAQAPEDTSLYRHIAERHARPHQGRAHADAPCRSGLRWGPAAGPIPGHLPI